MNQTKNKKKPNQGFAYLFHSASRSINNEGLFEALPLSHSHPRYVQVGGDDDEGEIKAQEEKAQGRKLPDRIEQKVADAWDRDASSLPVVREQFQDLLDEIGVENNHWSIYYYKRLATFYDMETTCYAWIRWCAIENYPKKMIQTLVLSSKDVVSPNPERNDLAFSYFFRPRGRTILLGRYWGLVKAYVAKNLIGGWEAVIFSPVRSYIYAILIYYFIVYFDGGGDASWDDFFSSFTGSSDGFKELIHLLVDIPDEWLQLILSAPFTLAALLSLSGIWDARDIRGKLDEWINQVDKHLVAADKDSCCRNWFRDFVYPLLPIISSFTTSSTLESLAYAVLYDGRFSAEQREKAFAAISRAALSGRKMTRFNAFLYLAWCAHGISLRRDFLRLYQAGYSSTELGILLDIKGQSLQILEKSAEDYDVYIVAEFPERLERGVLYLKVDDEAITVRVFERIPKSLNETERKSLESISAIPLHPPVLPHKIEDLTVCRSILLICDYQPQYFRCDPKWIVSEFPAWVYRKYLLWWLQGQQTRFWWLIPMALLNTGILLLECYLFYMLILSIWTAIYHPHAVEDTPDATPPDTLFLMQSSAAALMTSDASSLQPSLPLSVLLMVCVGKSLSSCVTLLFSLSRIIIPSKQMIDPPPELRAHPVKSSHVKNSAVFFAAGSGVLSVQPSQSEPVPGCWERIKQRWGW